MVSSVYTRVPCSTTGCTKAAVHFCRYPIMRNGRQTFCNRRVCQRCANADRFCPPHARLGAEALIKICTTCLTSSCPSGSMVCSSPGPTRLVTRATFLNILSFGIL